VALTDGAEWRLYNAHAPVPVEQKLFRAVRLTEDLEATFELLALLSKDNLRDNRLQELWRGFFVDRQVNAALGELFNAGEPARDLVALVAKRVPNLTKGDIRASLVRARAAFDFPTPSLPTTPVAPAPPAGPATPPGPAGVGKPPRAGWTPVSGAERRVTVQEVLGSGRLQAGSRLEADYRGQHHVAELLGDGRIRLAGETYGSLSSAGAAVKRAVLGPDIPPVRLRHRRVAVLAATDARAGDTTTLRVIRQRVATDHTG
jgi:Restriction Enzyme Adenine Methylase Associated